MQPSSGNKDDLGLTLPIPGAEILFNKPPK
jgi:hypothetical protein